MATTSSEQQKPFPSLTMPTVLWQLSAFAELTGYQVYHIIQAREQVFVKDQNCSYVDADGVDFAALHLCAYQQHAANSSSSNANLELQLLAYCRIIPPTVTADGFPHIGRVLVLADYRGHGLARQLMLKAIDYCHNQFCNQPIHISAQTYLIEFYQTLGFVCIGDVYSNDSIEHVNMVLAAL